MKRIAAVAAVRDQPISRRTISEGGSWRTEAKRMMK
jgi:hypothetical protein